MTVSHLGSLDPRDAIGLLPTDRPFLRMEARERGLSGRLLTELVVGGWLARPIVGVYYAGVLPDSLELRLRCLRLVVPEDAVVTDRSAAWLWGASMALAPHDDCAVPRVSVFRQPGYRLRNGLTASGSRDLADRDVTELQGLRVTTPLRTACDLGRLLTREQAIAALDALARATELTPSLLQAEACRFRGYRGVRQLRALAPLVDARAQSPGESIVRLRWWDCAELPRPEPQLEVPAPRGSFFLDLGVWRPRFAVEYDGVRWHGEDRAAHDAARRAWIRRELGFTLWVVTRDDLRTEPAQFMSRLRSEYAVAHNAARRPAYWISDRTA